MVRAYATFSDGSVQDVTSDATFLSTRPEYMTILPRSGDDNQQAEVTAEVSVDCVWTGVVLLWEKH